MSRKRRYRSQRYETEDGSPIISFFTGIILLLGFWLSTILGVIGITICLFTGIHILNNYYGRYKKKKYMSFITYIIGIFIIIGGIYLIVINRTAINDKFKEISNGSANYMSIGQNKKGGLELQPNKQGILLKLLNNMFTTTGQVQ